MIMDYYNFRIFAYYGGGEKYVPRYEPYKYGASTMQMKWLRIKSAWCQNGAKKSCK